MNQVTVVWHEPTDSFAVCTCPSMIATFVNDLLGRPGDTNVEVIPKEFHVMSGIPLYGVMQ